MMATASLSVGVAGCLSDGTCETVVNGTETVERNDLRVYDAEANPGQRLYVRLRRLDGPPARLGVFDPEEEPLVELQDVERLERIFEIPDSGTYSVVTENDSTADVGQWLTTVAVYQGWCPDVF